MRLPVLLALLLDTTLFVATTTDAQTVHLRQLHTGLTEIDADVGDTLSIEVTVDFGDLHAPPGWLSTSACLHMASSCSTTTTLDHLCPLSLSTVRNSRTIRFPPTTSSVCPSVRHCSRTPSF